MKPKRQSIRGKLMFAHHCLFTEDGNKNEQIFYFFQAADGTVSVLQTATLAKKKKGYSRRQDACKGCITRSLPEQMIEMTIVHKIEYNRRWDNIKEKTYEIWD